MDAFRSRLLTTLVGGVDLLPSVARARRLPLLYRPAGPPRTPPGERLRSGCSTGTRCAPRVQICTRSLALCARDFRSVEPRPRRWSGKSAPSRWLSELHELRGLGRVLASNATQGKSGANLPVPIL